LENTIKLKPDYAVSYYALGIFYHQLAIDAKGKVVNEVYNQKAIDTLKEQIKRLGQTNKRQMLSKPGVQINNDVTDSYRSQSCPLHQS